MGSIDITQIFEGLETEETIISPTKLNEYQLFFLPRQGLSYSSLTVEGRGQAEKGMRLLAIAIRQWKLMPVVYLNI